MDVTDAETRVKDSLVGNKVTGNWKITTHLVQVESDNTSRIDFLLNPFREHPTGTTLFELHVEDDPETLWADEDFAGLCDEFGVTGNYRIIEEQDDRTPGFSTKFVIEAEIETTDPHTGVDFIRDLAELPNPEQGEEGTDAERDVESEPTKYG